MTILRDKMNCGVGLETVFSEFHWCTSSAASFHAAKANQGNSQKTVYKTYSTVQFVSQCIIISLPKKSNIIVILFTLVKHVGKADYNDFHKGDEQVEYEPKVYHFNIGSPGQRFRSADEQCCEHKKCCHIHGHICFKVFRLVEIKRIMLNGFLN